MSWWDSGKEDVIGDHPADLIKAALRAVAAERDRQQRVRPTLADVLAALLRTLNAEQDTLLADASGFPLGALVARAQPANVRVDAASAGRDEELEHHLRAALREIATTYQERWERRPRLSEVLETLAFILRYRPERFLSGAEGLAIEEITADGT